jgi:hypothetical protein
MINETAATVVDSATTQPAEPQPTNTWTDEQLSEWQRTGAIPKFPPKTQDSAPAKKDAVADSAPRKDKTSADTAPESATGTERKPHLKTSEDTEKRFKEILDEVKALRAERDEYRRATSEKRETKQESQPAPDGYKPLDEKEYFASNPKATYEDFVRAAAKHEARWEARQEIAADNRRRETEAAQKELKTRIEAAKKLYPDFDQRQQPIVKALTEDQQIPHAVKALVNDSPVFEHLLYTLGEPAAMADLIQTAKTNPALAIRKIVLTEHLIQQELDKAAKVAKVETKAPDSEKTAPEPKPRAPKPPAEVGGRGAASEDAAVSAARNGNFAAFEAEMSRKYRPA